MFGIFNTVVGSILVLITVAIVKLYLETLWLFAHIDWVGCSIALSLWMEDPFWLRALLFHSGNPKEDALSCQGPYQRDDEWLPYQMLHRFVVAVCILCTVQTQARICEWRLDFFFLTKKIRDPWFFALGVDELFLLFIIPVLSSKSEPQGWALGLREPESCITTPLCT